jgi:hypothetical protein
MRKMKPVKQKYFFRVHQSPDGVYLVVRYSSTERETLQKLGRLGEGISSLEFKTREEAERFAEEKITERIKFLKRNLEEIKK